MKYIFIFSLALVILSGCKTSNEEKQLQQGSGVMYITASGENIPLRIIYGDSGLTFINAEEKIVAENFEIEKDSIYFEMPVYGSHFKGKITSDKTFKGEWHKTQSGPDYILPFTAKMQPDAFAIVEEVPTDKERYEVIFSPNSDDSYSSLGEFHQKGNTLTGTFITETGDYRYLQGRQNENNFWLSTFDGANLYYFKGTRTEDSIRGTFYSGRSFKEPFIGVRNQKFELTNPDSLTTATKKELQFDATKLNGEKKEFTSKDFQDQVTIVQVMGTWCPNCLDETRYYKSLYDEYESHGLEIIAVGFERGKTKEQKLKNLQRYREKLNIPYQVVLGGDAEKASASRVFPVLSEIKSFPTSIFIGKEGKIRKIHTGFYGPGTGDWYKNYTSETEEFVETLLSE